MLLDIPRPLCWQESHNPVCCLWFWPLPEPDGSDRLPALRSRHPPECHRPGGLSPVCQRFLRGWPGVHSVQEMSAWFLHQQGRGRELHTVSGRLLQQVGGSLPLLDRSAVVVLVVRSECRHKDGSNWWLRHCDCDCNCIFFLLFSYLILLSFYFN